MKNTLELIENNEVVATTSFEIIDIKSSVWIDSLDKEQKQEEGHTKTAFYGENLKLLIETEGIDDGTELEIEISAKNDEGTTVEIKDDNDQPIKIIAKATSNKVTFEPFYLNPKWFNKKASITYFFNLKIKEETTYIGENLPTEVENQLKPIGFGKPDEFKIDKAKGYLLEKNKDGTKTAYTSGKLEDVEKYQEWFENESEELIFSNKKQIESYFKSVYMTYLFHWTPRGEFGNSVNRNRVIKAFNEAGKKHNLSASLLYTYACGEGMISDYKNHHNNLDEPVMSFQTYGLDFFEKDAPNLIAEGYLSSSFTSGGLNNARIGDSYNPPTPFPNGANYAFVRISGKPMTRNEAGGIMDVYPVWFKNLEDGIEGATAVYARAYQLAINDANTSGWNKLNINQKAFFGYHKIQNFEKFSSFYEYDSEIFLKGKYSINPNIEFIKHKAFHRFVAWRYILLGKYFND